MPASSFSALVLIALGGALGSVVRTLIGQALQTRFPWATLLINAAGSFLIGWLGARLGAIEAGQAARLHGFLVAGFCGGFTTFSTFSWQTLDQMLKGQWAAAAANVVLSVAVCLLAVWLGWKLGHLWA